MREWRAARRAGGGEGYLELEWAPGTAQVDFGNFEADVAGGSLALKLLVVSLPHSNARYARACMSQRSECMCEGLSVIFGQIGRAPAALVLDNATEAGRMSRGEVTESRLFSLFRAHYRCASRYCNPYSGNEKGSVENAVGFIRRNLLVPVPSVGTLEELNGMLEAGCARLNAASRYRDGRPVAETLAEDLAAITALPADPFDAVRWVRVRIDKRGYVTVVGREYMVGLVWHSRELLVGVRASTVEMLADRGRSVALLLRAWGAGEPVRNSFSLVSVLVARPRAFGESTIGHDMPSGLVEAVDHMNPAGCRQTLRSISRAAETSGFEDTCGGDAAHRRGQLGAERRDRGRARQENRRRRRGGRGRRRPRRLQRVPEWSRVPCWLATRWRRVVDKGRRCSLSTSVLEEWARRGTPRQVEYLAGCLEAECGSRDASRRAQLLRRRGLPAPKVFDGYDWSAVSWPDGLGQEDLLSPSFLERGGGELVLLRDVVTGKTHMASDLWQLACDRRLETRFFTASSLVMRLRRARDEGRLGREAAQLGHASLLIIDELGFLPLDADGARFVSQVFAGAYKR